MVGCLKRCFFEKFEIFTKIRGVKHCNFRILDCPFLDVWQLWLWPIYKIEETLFSFIMMQSGTTHRLDQIIKRERKLSENKAKRIFQQITREINYLRLTIISLIAISDFIIVLYFIIMSSNCVILVEQKMYRKS